MNSPNWDMDKDVLKESTVAYFQGWIQEFFKGGGVQGPRNGRSVGM